VIYRDPVVPLPTVGCIKVAWNMRGKANHTQAEN